MREEARYCPECGAYIPTGKKRCLACGYTEEKTENGELENDFYTLGKYCSATAYTVPPMLPFAPIDVHMPVSYRSPVQSMFNGTGIQSTHTKTEIDLDSILGKEYFFVKLGGKTFPCYMENADMELGTTIYHTKEMFSKISLYEQGKKKIHLTFIER